MTFRKILEFLLLVPKKEPDINLLSEHEYVKAKDLYFGDVLYTGEEVKGLSVYPFSERVSIETTTKTYSMDQDVKVKIKRRF